MLIYIYLYTLISYITAHINQKINNFEYIINSYIIVK
jgi:hypothetical protein